MTNLKEEKSFLLNDNQIFFYIFLFIKKIISSIFRILLWIILFMFISQAISYFIKDGSFFNNFERDSLNSSRKNFTFFESSKKEDSFYNNHKWIDFINNSKARNEIKKRIENVSLLDSYRTKLIKNSFNKGGMIFYGPPGTGKSHCAELIAKNISSSYTIVAAGSFQEIYVGSGSKKWNNLIASCRRKLENYPKDENRPIVIIVEEIDSLIYKGKYDHGKDDTLVNNFLGSFDEIKRDNLNILIIGTTNYAHFIEEAAIREGRLSAIEFGFPKEEYDIDSLLGSVKNKIEKEYSIEYSLSEFNLNLEDNKIFVKKEYWINLKIEIINICKNDPFLNLIFPKVLSAVENTFLYKINSKSKNLNILIDEKDSAYTIKDILESNSSQRKNIRSEENEKIFSDLIERMLNSEKNK